MKKRQKNEEREEEKGVEKRGGGERGEEWCDPGFRNEVILWLM